MFKAAVEAASDRRRAIALCPALEARKQEFDHYAQLLEHWGRRINLVAPATLPHLWTRHFADCAQLLELFPNVTRWADMGSGAGFPGLVLAILLKGRDGACVHLIESDQRKAAFLRAVSRETGAPAIVAADRVERVLPTLEGQIEAVTARALAPLCDLVDLAEDLLLKNTLGVFLKGQDWSDELTRIKGAHRFEVATYASRTQNNARIVAISREMSVWTPND